MAFLFTGNLCQVACLQTSLFFFGRHVRTHLSTPCITQSQHPHHVYQSSTVYATPNALQHISQSILLQTIY